MTSVILFWIYAILSPLIYAFMNIFEKYVITKKVKRPLSFAFFSALTMSLFGIILSFFLNWDGLNLSWMIFPAIAGLLMGSNYFIYFFILKRSDASNVIGIMYIYPIFVCMLSFIFLGEILPLTSYMGIVLILLGAVFLSLHTLKIKFKVSLWMIFGMALIVAVDEFLVKVTTINLPELNGMVISLFFIGVVALLMLFNSNIRKGIRYESRNIGWSICAELITLPAFLTLYLAMSGLSASIVSSIAAIQPLFLLFYERVAQNIFGNISKDELVIQKLGYILLIILGIALLYLS